MKPHRTDGMLPPMRCDDGCGRCCGVVAAPGNEFDRINTYAKANGIEPVDQGITCPWYQGGRCAVYPVRPTICRIFGHSERMVCPRGYNTNISSGLERSLFNPVIVQSRRNGVRILHEVVRSADDTAALVLAALSNTTEITVHGRAIRRPADPRAYDAGRLLKLAGHPMLRRLTFEDENTGETT